MRLIRPILLISLISLIGLIGLISPIFVNHASAATNVYYSVGQNTDDHKTGSPTVTIKDGIATFSVPQTARNMGVGDYVSWSGGGAYISAKITTSKWRLINPSGTTAGDVGPISVTSIAHAFASLNAAVGGATPGTKALTSNSVDLTSLNIILNIPLYYDTGPDTTAVTISAYTTSPTQYIRIYTPTNTSTEVNQSQRHNGKWDNGKWRMEITNLTPIILSNKFVRIDGLQFKMTSNSTPNVFGIYMNPASGSEIQISNNIVWGVLSGAGLGGNYGIAQFSDNSLIKIWNNIVYGWISGSTSDIKGISAYNGIIYNNTIYNSYVGFSGGDGNPIAKNNLIYNNTTDYTGSFNSASTGNLSKDGTAPAYNAYYTGATVKFVNASKGDFHLMSTDSAARGFGANLYTDANIPVTTDIDGQARPSAVSKTPFDIGADQTQEQTKIISRPNSALPATPAGVTNVYFSVGQNNTVDYKTGAPNVTITSGIATFTQPQTARNIGVGDVIVVGGTSYYISAKITQSKWRVVTALGTTPDDLASTALTSWKHVFASLNGAVGGSCGASNGTYALFGNSCDLTSKNVVLNIPLYYDTGPDTTAVSISAFNTDADHYIRIYTPTNTSTEVNQSQRHSGKWTTNAWRMELTGGGVYIESNYVKIDGLQIKNADSTGSQQHTIIVMSLTAGNNKVEISNNIIWGAQTNGSNGDAILVGYGTTAENAYIYNNVIYGFTDPGYSAIYFYANGYAYNNTIFNNSSGIRSEGPSGSATVKNNILNNNVSYNLLGGTSFNSNSDYNATDKSSWDSYTPGVHDRVSQTFKFVNASKKDFHLMSTDTSARGFGANLYTDANIPVTTDIDGQARPSAVSKTPFDIGADQTESKTKIISRPNSALPATPVGVTNVYYSVGQNTDDHKTGSPNVTIANGIATFSVPQTARNMGVGDHISAGSTVNVYISGKITQSKWRVVTNTGNVPPDISGQAVNYIRHEFASLNDAVGGESPGVVDATGYSNLLNGNMIVNISLYYDTGPDITPVMISAFTTDADHYIRIYTPTNTSTEVNQSQRHNGKWDTGKWRMEITTPTTQAINIRINYIRIDGLQILMNSSSGTNSELIYGSLQTAPNEIFVSNNILRGSLSGTVDYVKGIFINDDDAVVKIWNNIVYDINVGNNSEGIDVGRGTVYVSNNTIVNCYLGIGGSWTGGTVIAKNNIVKNSGDTNAYLYTFDAASTNNATDGTDTMTGAGGTNYTSQTFRFVNASKNDFHLMSTDTGARGFGANLSNDANLPFSTDIDGQARPAVNSQTQWDIGADQKPAPMRISN